MYAQTTIVVVRLLTSSMASGTDPPAWISAGRYVEEENFSAELPIRGIGTKLFVELAHIDHTFSSRGREASARIGRNEDSPMKPCGHTANWWIKALANPGGVIRALATKKCDQCGLEVGGALGPELNLPPVFV